MPETPHNCTCWRCWIQANFSAILLFSLLMVSLFATLVLMHEEIIADKYVIWLEGWDAGLLTSLGVALNTDTTGKRRDHAPDPPQEPKP